MDMDIFGASQLDSALDQSRTMLERFTDTFLNGRSVITFIVAFAIAAIIGRIIAAIMRRFARALSRRADKAQGLKEVNRLRRIETLTILTIALIKMMLFVMAVYFWWLYAHPSQQPTAIIGAGALAILIAGATVGPILRDLANGSVMMAEHWFGVGDFVKVEPFGDLTGIVERVTLRSTRIRGINGEVIWINNQNIQGVRISPKGVSTIALDLFVSSLKGGLDLIKETNLRLPTSSLMIARPLHIMAKIEVAPNLWHITAIGETAPGREWLLEKHAVDILKELDEGNKKKILQANPIAHYADQDAEQRFARTIQNARKSPLQRKRLPLPEAIARQLPKPLAQRQAAHRRQAKKIQ